MFEFIKKALSGSNDAEIKRLRKTVEQIGALEGQMQKLSDEEMRAYTGKLRERAKGGEELSAFAHRVCMGALSNPDFEAFCKKLTLARYARAPLGAADLETGVRAYRRMRRSVRRSERWRFDLRRALHGLGDITAIP